MQHGPTSVCDVFSVYLWCNREFSLFILRNDPVLTAHKNPITVRLVLPKRWRIPSPPHPCSPSISSCLGIFYLGGWWYIEQLLQIHWFRCLLPPPPLHPPTPVCQMHSLISALFHPPPPPTTQESRAKCWAQVRPRWNPGSVPLIFRVPCAGDCQGSLADECWGSLCWWLSGFPVPVNAGVLCADDCWGSLCQWMLGLSVLMIVLCQWMLGFCVLMIVRVHCGSECWGFLWQWLSGFPVPVNVRGSQHWWLLGFHVPVNVGGVLSADDCWGSMCQWMLGFSVPMIVGVPCCDKCWGSLCWWLSGSVCSGVC